MITTSTSTTNANHLQKNAENLCSELFEEFDSAFYENIRFELDGLAQNPKDETIEKILAYSKAK